MTGNSGRENAPRAPDAPVVEAAVVRFLAATILWGSLTGGAGWIAAIMLWRFLFGIEASELQRSMGMIGLGVGGMFALLNHIQQTGRRPGPGPGWTGAVSYSLILFAVAAAIGFAVLPVLPAGPDRNTIDFSHIWVVFGLAMMTAGGHWLAFGLIAPRPDPPMAAKTDADGGPFALVEKIFGRFPLELAALYLGLLVAWLGLRAAIPDGWCGGAAAGSKAALLTLAILASRGSSFPMTKGRMVLLAATGLVGGMAAFTAAWLAGDCTGWAAWLGWERGAVEMLAVAPVALVVTLFSASVADACGLEPKLPGEDERDNKDGGEA